LSQPLIFLEDRGLLQSPCLLPQEHRTMCNSRSCGCRLTMLAFPGPALVHCARRPQAAHTAPSNSKAWPFMQPPSRGRVLPMLTSLSVTSPAGTCTILVS
jgi:hypothetical protein